MILAQSAAPIVLLSIGLLFGCSGWVSPPRVVAERYSHGVYEVIPERYARRGMSHHPAFEQRSAGRRVACEAGTIFGAIYRLKLVGGTRTPLVTDAGGGRGSGRVSLGSSGQRGSQVKLEVRWTHPPFVHAGRMGRSTSTEESHLLSTRAGYTRMFGWRLEREELVDGDWKLEVRHGEQTLLEEDFIVNGCSAR